MAALLKEPRTVEAYGPELLGREHQIDLDKKAGKANVEWRIAQLSLSPLPGPKVEELLQKVKEKATETRCALDDAQFVELYKTVST